MKFIVLILLLQSSLVFAEKKAAEKDLSLLGKIDEESMKKAEPTKLAQDASATTNKSNFYLSCKDSSGKEFKKGEVGYDTCLGGIKNQHDMNKLNAGTNKKNDQDRNSATVNFKIGE